MGQLGSFGSIKLAKYGVISPRNPRGAVQPCTSSGVRSMTREISSRVFRRCFSCHCQLFHSSSETSAQGLGGSFIGSIAFANIPDDNPACGNGNDKLLMLGKHLPIPKFPENILSSLSDLEPFPQPIQLALPIDVSLIAFKMVQMQMVCPHLQTSLQNFA